ncbi:MAG: undecaprenyldiphospho-muramoylpentapeptide beta-N-acetylglucosaminyltransferase [Pseudomonadota bacterium]
MGEPSGQQDARGVIVIAAGGTGGHMFPAEALASELGRRGWRIALVTDARGERYAAQFPCDHKYMVDAATFSGRGLAGKVGAAFAIAGGVFRSVGLLRRLKPAAVIGFGGYPSLPAMAAATILRLPRAIHEQNAILGRVNRAFASHVTRIAGGFPGMGRLPTGGRDKLQFIGNPVRDAVRARAGAPYEAPNADGPVRVLIFGGSQGARILSEAAPKAFADLPPPARARLRLVQQCREEDLESVRSIYEAAGIEAELAPFFRDLADRLAAAHLVVSRAGASSVTELAVIGRPSVLVPFAAAMDDHQTANAAALANAGACAVIAEQDFTPARLRAELTKLLSDDDGLQRMAEAARGVGRADSAERLADLVEDLAGGERAVATSARASHKEGAQA